MDFLTDSERQYIGEDNERKRAVAVGRLSELALAVQNTEQVLDALRETDVETARKIGKAAREVMTLLERLSIAEVVSDEQESVAAPEEMLHVEEVKPEMQEEEQAPQHSTEVEVPVAELEPEAEADVVSEIEASIPESAQDWLQKILGDDWREKLGVKEGDSLEELAAKVLSGIRTRKGKGKPDNLYTNRIVALLQGQKAKDIAATEADITPAAIYQFEVSLRKRLNGTQPRGNDKPEATHTPDPTPTPRLRVVPHQRTEAVVTPDEDQDQELEQLPDHIRFAQLLEQQLELSTTERASLVGFLDPKSRGEMTNAKQSAIEKVVQYLRPRIENPEYMLTPEELKWVRQCFGIFVLNGTEATRPPVPLNELRRNIRDAKQGPRVEQAVFLSLQKLLVEGPQATVKDLYSSDFMQAALNPETVSEERFSELRQELATMLEKRFDESVAHEINQAIENDTAPARIHTSSPSLREAFARIRQLIGGEAGTASTTGDGDIDWALRRFVAVARVGSMAAEMNKEEFNLYQRRVIAGLYANLQGDEGSER